MSSISDTTAPDADDHSDDVVEFFWRPGCPFCMHLERALTSSDIPLLKRNIWDEPEAAAFVREVANGNETVPTVRLGSVALVNPSPAEVATVMSTELPELAGRMAQLPQPGPIGKLLRRILGG